MSYKDKTDQEVIEESRKLRRQLVEIDERLKEIYLLFKDIKITQNEKLNSGTSKISKKLRSDSAK
jgi:hypothetical protein